jgi:hypothetical protein
MWEIIKYMFYCLSLFISAAFGNNPDGLTWVTGLIGFGTLVLIILLAALLFYCIMLINYYFFMDRSANLKDDKIMNKKQIAFSLIPIIGVLMYLIPIFIQSIHTKNLTNWHKALASFFLGMLSFIVIYGGFALISNLSNFNLESNMWLIYTMLYLSFVIWNVVFFLSYNRLTKNLE